MKSSAALDVINRPVTALEDEYPKGYIDIWHHHKRSQLVYAIKGILTIITDDGSYILPPQRALWIPAGVEHMATCRSDVSIRTLYIEPDARANLPKKCRVIEVSELLRSLILQAMKIPAEYNHDSREGRIMRLILDEIELMPIEPLLIPMPQDKRLSTICQNFVNDPTQNQALEYWAKSAGMSLRTFTRLFRQETNMSFSTWRQHARLLEALSRLSVGEPVTTVAFDVGYNSSSAFTSMFHKTFGVPPSKYF
ncbi:AraC family transcriptional regulator [Kordiimonas pumila]|uniref:AraC family transcriptional regulator n=1 Tax=Kordiimonas pumila TaxID=2161677 RepID=A0ABV7D100_9PROT|nr:helix-turn-helix transcriptional regulator [Kordiimonas pumila]